MSLLEARKTYKPFEYPWAYEYWKRQQQVHWMPEEVPLGSVILVKPGEKIPLDGVVVSALVGASKPARAIFDTALAAVDVAAHAALHVGDSPTEVDTSSAIAA